MNRLTFVPFTSWVEELLVVLRRASFVLLIIIFLEKPACLSQSAPSSSVARAQRHLLELKVDGVMNTDAPSDVREGVNEFKKTLALETDAVVSRLSNGATTELVERELAKVMPPTSVGKAPDQVNPPSDDDLEKPVAGLYGGALTISVKKPRSSLMLVQEGFDNACGDDNILLVYSNSEGAWKRILLWQSKPYGAVSEAFGDTYETLVLRSEHHGHPLLLVLHGTPWCTSTMSSFSMDVFELDGSSNNMPFWHGQHDYRRLDEDPPLTLRSTVDGFEVRTSVSSTGEQINQKGERYAVVARKGIMRYSVAADSIRRVEPIAMNARDSVEEWLEMPRSEAAEFADEQEGSLTWKMFQEFTYRGKSDNAATPYSGVADVRACRDDPAHFQAHVTSEIFSSTGPGSRPGPAYFVQLQQSTSGYRIHRVTQASDPACGGADLMSWLSTNRTNIDSFRK